MTYDQEKTGYFVINYYLLVQPALMFRNSFHEKSIAYIEIVQRVCNFIDYYPSSLNQLNSIVHLRPRFPAVSERSLATT